MSRSTIPALHLIGNALLFWLCYYWLGISESDGPHLLWSALVILLLISGATWLHGLALAHYSGNSPKAATVLSTRHLVPLLTLSLLAIGGYGVLFWLSENFGGWGYIIGSYATITLNKPVPPANIERALHVLLLLLRWIVIPAALVPLAASIAVEGWRGYRWHALRRRHQSLYLVEVAALLFGAIWIPLKLFFWMPSFSGFGAQMASFLLRVGTGYLLFVAGVLALEFVTSSGKPRDTQPRTVSSP